MTPGARIAAAIEVLEDIAKRRRPIAEALKDWGLSHRFAGSKDRAAIGNIVYDSERRRRSLAWIMGGDTARSLALAAVARGSGDGVAGLAAVLEAPYSPPPLTAEETARLKDGDLAAAPEPIRADVPDWLVPSLARSLGEGWPAELAAMAERPPLDIRVNRLRADRAKVLRALAPQGVAETTFAPCGLRVAPATGAGRHPNLQVEPAFQKGWFEIQDEGSQLAALLVGAREGDQILDLCAGGGGKTLALASLMANKGQIHATDSDKHRLAPIFERLRRAGTRNVQVHPAGADLSAQADTMDRVLIDAPCSGSGTWRRHPDAKWRLSDRALADRVAGQAAILDQAARFVRPGGLLFYVTCSILPQENEDQVSAFLERSSEFHTLPASEMLAGSGLDPDDAKRLAAAVLATAHGIQMTPLRTGTDGFFIAALRKAA